MAAYKIYTETIVYADSEEEAWEIFGWLAPDEFRWDIKKIVKTD